VTSVIVQIGTALGDLTRITWIVGGWSIASSVSFSIAGSLSDIFGRRYLIIAGNLATLVGAVGGSKPEESCNLN
jgi:MFS family permease